MGQHLPIRRCALLAIAAVAATLLLPGTVGAAEPAVAGNGATLLLPGNAARAAEPALTVDRAAVKAGERVGVRAAGWTPGNLVLEVCGNQAGNGSVDCAVDAATSIAVAGDGTGAANLVITVPPAPCPCVLRARALVGGAAAVTPLVIHGAKTRPASQLASARQPKALTIGGARLTGGGSSWAALIGGPARRTLTVTVRNTGAAPVPEPRLSIVAGRPGQPTIIVAVPSVGALAAGQERTLAIPVTFGAPTWGSYSVRVEARGADQPVVGHAHTYSYPWLLFLLPLLGGALAVRRLLRRRAGLPARRPTRVPSAGHD